MTIAVSRRRFLASAGLATAGVGLASGPDAAAPPKETGLSSEGLLVGRPGFQTRTTMPLPREELRGLKAWAILVYDPYDDRWHDAVMNSDDDGVWIGGNPLVVCDVADHAFSRDYGRRED